MNEKDLIFSLKHDVFEKTGSTAKIMLAKPSCLFQKNPERATFSPLASRAPDERRLVIRNSPISPHGISVISTHRIYRHISVLALLAIYLG